MEKLSDVAVAEDLGRTEKIPETEPVKFKNGMLEAFVSNQDIKMFMEADYSAVMRNKVFRFCTKVINSNSMVAYQKQRQEMIDAQMKLIQEWDKEHAEEIRAVGDPRTLEGRPSDSLIDIPEFVELMNADAEFEIRKFVMSDDEIPKAWKTSDMLKLSWIIEFME